MNKFADLTLLKVEDKDAPKFKKVLIGDSEQLAHASTQLCYVERKHPFATAQLSDQELSIDFAQYASPDDRVAVVVTAPLTTNEVWTPFAPGELAVFVAGQRMD